MDYHFISGGFKYDIYDRGRRASLLIFSFFGYGKTMADNAVLAG